MNIVIKLLLILLLFTGCTSVKEEKIAEDGVYDQKDDVALYLETYHKLPGNYITKNEARKLGWEGGSLSEVVEGKCIGGDYYANYEGKLPENEEYHECDIDTLQSKSRGAKRIVYSEDWDIYYTDDHYETFELLYEGDLIDDKDSLSGCIQNKGQTFHEYVYERDISSSFIFWKQSGCFA